MTVVQSRRSFLGTAGTVGGLGLLGLAGCAGGPAGTPGKTSLRLYWSGSQETNRIFLSVIDAFGKKHPEIEIRPEYGAGSGAADKLATQIAGGNGPDVIVGAANLLTQYVKQGVIFPLDEYVPELIKTDDIDPRVLANATVDGKLVAVPLGVNAHGLMYDETVFEQAKITMPPPDWTWDEFAETADGLHDALGADVAGTEDAGGKKQAFELFVRQRGKPLFNGSALGIGEDDFAEWLEFWDKLRGSGGCVSADVQALYDQMANSPLVTGKAPMLFGAADNILGAIPLVKHKLKLHFYPRGPKGAPNGFYLLSNTMYVGYNRSDHKREVATVIGAVMTDPEIAVNNMVEHGMPPSEAVRKATAEKLDGDAKDVFAFIESYAEEAGDPPPPDPPGSAEIGDILERANTDVGFKRASIPDATRRFFDDMAAALKT